MIYRYSSRRQKLYESFMNEKLKGALSYDRIAGYFSSSIFEVSGEAIDSVEGRIRIVCNSGLGIEDVKTASAAVNAMRREWCAYKPEEVYKNAPERLRKLYNLIKSGKLMIKVIPDEVFGLIHGKAGVITLKDGNKTSFIGSANETYSGWKLNYELIWEDDSPEAVKWVQEEFDYFWNSPYAVPLSDFVIEDIDRISRRRVISKVDDWKANNEPASVVVESPVYRQELGLWEHQKYFVKLAFDDHKKSYGARYVLADMVGLGKTVQLALSAELMALYGDKPILIIVPKTLIWQWQNEMIDLLDMPSAVWNGREWVDENGIKYPSKGDEDIKKCPRRVGIISQGLITANSDVIKYLLDMKYECVIVDEAHRARRKNLNKEGEKAEPNNLMKFLSDISLRTKSMILATATPVQIDPIEAWDLLNILSQGNDSVLGNEFSMWRRYPEESLKLITGEKTIDPYDPVNWDWIRNPFPPASEDPATFGVIRSKLNLKDDEFVIKPEMYDKLSGPDKRRIGRIIDNNFFREYNPFIRHIVRRTREYLENTINPETQEPYLQKIAVKLYGESDDEAITLPPYLKKAYEYAEEFSRLLGERVRAGGFMKTLLLRRLGSTIVAGKNTAEKMLNWGSIDDDDIDEEENISELKNLTGDERQCLINFIETLSSNTEKDPKYRRVYELIVDEDWYSRGCIIFSQYYDSAYWIAESLSNELKDKKIGIYAGGDKSGLFINGIFQKMSKEKIKDMVRKREIKILVGTDAASEGLNLQTLGSLINLDLPWNPTRLEQRKGRIQRIGQIYDEVYIYNMRYKDSVEDRVHELLSERLENIHNIFGQIPDILEDVWVDVALNNIEEAKKRINALPKKNPFELRYNEKLRKIDWESCANVLDNDEKKKYLMKGWNGK
ncbi:MAG TPA: DEAD/DEAH box helicase family protein [Thermoanaerobacterium sp.]|nr:DEAD/DEAH box helicase family protein [Thermoanaerobacterium sp.]